MSKQDMNKALEAELRAADYGHPWDEDLPGRAADALAAARAENEYVTAMLGVTEGIVLDRAAEINVARAALAEANRKIEATAVVLEKIKINGEPALAVIDRITSSALEHAPEPLPLDPEPWLCTFPKCSGLGLHREAKRDALREGRTFEPREGYEQDRARYEGNTDV